MKRIETMDGLATAYDLAVVGAGPAGLAAAAQASGLGLKVLLADENAEPGGQIYRAITTTPVKRKDVLGKSYWEGLELARAMQASECDYAPQSTVWSVEPVRDETGAIAEPRTFEIGLSRGGRARLVHARRVILATGAIERPVPVPGWTLPGVMTAGAAQIALKTAGLVPADKTVIAGSGPLLWLLAGQLKQAGARIVAVLDMTPAGRLKQAMALLPGFLASPYALQGLKLAAKAHFSLPVRRSAENVRIEGEGRVQRVTYRRAGRDDAIECDQVLLHVGVIPNINMPNALGCSQHWDSSIHAWAPDVDEWFNSSVPGIAIAGDGANIAGATSAAVRGRIAAVAAAHAVGHLDDMARDRLGKPMHAEANRLCRGRSFIDALYRPADSVLRPSDPATIVCRCEEISAGQIRSTVRDLHVQGPNQLKAYLRSGMGPCQGRMCASSVNELIAQERGVPVEEVGHLRLRMPVKPITLEEIASMPQSQAAKNAVMR